MSINFRGHRPGYFDGFDAPPSLEFEKLEDLLAMEWVKRFSHSEGFNYYALDSSKFPGRATQYSLMAVYKEGKEWWVVGFLTEGAETLGLPEILNYTNKVVNLKVS